MKIRVFKIESMSTVDGPGIRATVFLQGCPLRCGYCHNPESWSMDGGEEYTAQELANKLIRLKPYFGKDGGVTFSGGEPLVQAKALLQACKILKKSGIHIAIDTSGCIVSDAVKALLEDIDLVILDVKHVNKERYKWLTKTGDLDDTINFLEILKSNGIDYWIRQVIVPDFNDNEEQVQSLEEITRSPQRKKIELLPFHKMGMHKWHEYTEFNEYEDMKKDKVVNLQKKIKINV